MNRRDFFKGLRLRGAKRQGSVKCNFDGVGLLGYGCMRWPLVNPDDASEGIDQQKVDELVDYALAHGVNYFDSAPVYTKGQSEAATAKALSRHPRESYLIATKLSNQRGDFSFEQGWEMYRKSLQIYGTDHIDYYLLHNIGSLEAFNRRFIQNGLLDALLKERELGHIRHLGMSFHCDKSTFDAILDLHPKYHWDFVQIQMNYVDWNHASSGVGASYMYGRLAEEGIPVVIMEPLLGGGLAEVPSGIADRFKAAEPNASIASWAFRFCGSFPDVLTVLSGMTNKSDLVDNVGTFSDFKPLSGPEFEMLEQAAKEISSYRLVGCTGCQYCMPCPYGIDIPGIFRFYDDAVRSDSYIISAEQKRFERSRRKFLADYGKSVPTIRQADHCIGCSKCKPRCPQHIDIPKELRRIDRYIEKIKQGTL